MAIGSTAGAVDLAPPSLPHAAATSAAAATNAIAATLLAPGYMCDFSLVLWALCSPEAPADAETRLLRNDGNFVAQLHLAAAEG